MTLAERLAAIVQAVPDDGAVTLPVRHLREWIAAEGAPASSPAEKPSDDADRWLTADDVATALGVSRRYVYARRTSLPFAKQLPGGSVRFSERGLQRWMERRG